MGKYIKDNFLMIKETEKEFLFGKTIKNFKEIGLKENSMDKEN